MDTFETACPWDRFEVLDGAVHEAVLPILRRVSGGTITHHHAVGRVHRPSWQNERPEPFEAALRAAKRAVDPAGVMNPGALFDAER